MENSFKVSTPKYESICDFVFSHLPIKYSEWNKRLQDRRKLYYDLKEEFKVDPQLIREDNESANVICTDIDEFNNNGLDETDMIDSKQNSKYFYVLIHSTKNDICNI